MVAISEPGRAATMASATVPSTPVPGGSVEARLTTMCAAPVDGVQVMLLQSARGVKLGTEAARMGAPKAMMAAAMVFILFVVDGAVW